MAVYLVLAKVLIMFVNAVYETNVCFHSCLWYDEWMIGWISKGLCWYHQMIIDEEEWALSSTTENYLEFKGGKEIGRQ